MKTQTHPAPNRQLCRAAIFGILLVLSGTVIAGNISRSDDPSNLDQPAAWIGNVPPGLGDIAVWDNNVVTNGPSTLGLDAAWLGLAINNPGINITINAGNTLTLGASGVDMSAATTNLTLSCGVLIGATQTWNVANGRILSATAVISGTNGFIKSGGGVLGLSGANTWTNATILSNGVVSLDSTAATLGVNALNNTLVLAGGSISNNWGVNNQITHNNNIVVPTGTTGTIYMGNRIRLASNGNASTISGGGILNFVANTTVTRDDIGSQAGPFTGTVNFVNALNSSGQQGIRFFANAGAFSGFSNAVVNLDGNQAWNFNCNSGGNTFTFGTLQGTNTSAQLGFLSAGNFPRIVVGTLNTDSTLAGQFVNTATSLFKAGIGSWTLPANHAHSLSNSIQQGRIIFVTGGSCSNSSQTVISHAAGVGFKVAPGFAQWVGTNFIFSTGTTRLEFNVGGAIPSTTVAPYLNRGNLTISSSNVLVGIVGGNWSIGQFPLIKYTGTLGGTFGFSALILTNQPSGVLGYLSNNVANTSIDYVVTNSLVPLNWATGSGIWDINTTANWKNSAGATTNYQELGGIGDSVQFEDSQSGSSPITVTLNSSIVPVSVKANATKNFTISGTGGIGGSGSLTKQNTGSLTLTTANSFTGGSTLSGGIVNFSALNNLGAQNSPLVFGGGTLQYASGNTSDISLGRAVTIGAGGATLDTGANNVTNSTAIGNNGSGGLAKTGSGKLVLSGNNQYSGATSINQGTLALAAGASIAGSSSIVVNGGAILDVSASGLTLASGQTLTGTGAVLGNLTSPAGSTLAPGTSPGTLSCSNDVTLSGGTYVYDVSTNSGRDLIVVGGNLTLTSGTLQVNVTGTLTNGHYTVFQYSGTLGGAAGNIVVAGFSQSGKLATLDSSIPGKIDMVIQTVGGKGITWQGNGTDWDVEVSFNWLQGVVSTQYVNGDLVTFDDGGSGQPNVNLATSLLPGAITVNSAADYNFSTGGAGILSGTGLLTKNGSGKLTVLTANNRIGNNLISGGTVQVGNGSTTGDLGTGNITNNGALVMAQTDNRSINGAISGSGSLVQQGTATLVLANNNTYSGPTTISSGVLQVGSGGATGSLGSGAVTNAGTLVFNRSGTFAVNNGITGSGAPNPATLAKGGTGILTLGGVNTYEGNTIVTNGTLKLGASEVIPDGGATTGWLILDGSASTAGLLDLNGFNETVNALAGVGGAAVGVIANNTGTATNTLTVTEIAATTFAGNIFDNTGTGGKVSLRKFGPNTLTLTGNSSYSGGTYVGEGTLSIGNLGAGSGEILLTNGVTLNSIGFFGNDIRTTPASTAIVSTTLALGNNSTGGNFFGDAASTNSITGLMSFGTAGVKQFQNFLGTVRIESGAQMRFSSTTLSVNGGDNTLFEVIGQFFTRNGSGNGEGIAVGALTGGGIVSGGGQGGAVRMNIGARGMDTEFSGQMTGVAPNTLNIVKVGGGTLTLSGSIAFDGFLTVSNGTLLLTGGANLDSLTNTIAVRAGAFLDVNGMPSSTLTLGTLNAQTLTGSGTIRGGLTVNVNSTIAPGDTVGNLTITNTATLNGAINMELNRTASPNSDRITSPSINVNGAILNVTNLGPDLVTGDVFQLFSGPVSGTLAATNLPVQNQAATITYLWTNMLAINGSIKVLAGASPIAPNPTNITFFASGGNLDLSWPADHTGWELQTNSVDVANPTMWFLSPGSTTTNHVIFPINPVTPKVFYRLHLP